MAQRKTEVRRAGLRPDLSAAGAGVAGATEGQTFAGDSLLVRYVNLVRLPHTLFALPFALVGTVYGSRSEPVTVRQVVLVLVAFTAARFAAMGFNRIADRQLDAINPRTRNRELPSGRMTAGQAGVAVVVAGGLFLLAAALLNPLCRNLGPLALAWVLAYSYTKRFTSWSHLWLGASLAIAPAGGYLAVAGHWSTPGWVLYALSSAVMCWVAGFDIFYALQDREFDREHQLRSAVVLFGEGRSIVVAKLLHGLAILLLVWFGYGAELSWSYYGGVIAAAAVLAREHRLVKAGDLRRLDAAFFTMNGIMSIVVFTGMLVDRLL